MPRAARIVIPGMPHHVTQRGNNRQDVFFTDDDRRYYLDTLAEKAAAYGAEVLGYCLMRNHTHIIIVPRMEDALALTIGRTHWRYTQYVNHLHGRSGHLWQNRFFSCPMDDAHLLGAMRYVERNPVRSKLVRLPWRYPWSSAAAHCGERDDPHDLLWLQEWKQRWSPSRWRKILQTKDDEYICDDLRHATLNGRPLAGDKLIAKLERKLNRRLRRPPLGRPPVRG